MVASMLESLAEKKSEHKEELSENRKELFVRLKQQIYSYFSIQMEKLTLMRKEICDLSRAEYYSNAALVKRVSESDSVSVELYLKGK